MKGGHAHRLQHNFAFSYVKATGDAFWLQAMLGHSEMKMTNRYVDLASLDLTAKKFSVGDSLALVRSFWLSPPALAQAQASGPAP